MKWWLRAVAAMYGLAFVLAGVVHMPVSVLAPAGTLDRAAAGDGTAKLLVDTWSTIGLEFLAVMLVLLIASMRAARPRDFVWAVVAFEAVRGMGTDVFMLVHGYQPVPHIAWLVLHTIVIATGLWLRAREMRKAPHGAVLGEAL